MFYQRVGVYLNIEKRKDESLFDYHKRLVYGKLVDKTLSDIDYSELAELVYGKSYASDVARRMMYGSRKTIELLENNVRNTTSENLVSEMDDKIKELQKERQRFNDQRREYNKLINKDGRAEHLYQTLATAADNLADTIGVLDFSSKESEYNTNFTDDEAIIVFSDWHYGMTTDNIFNNYNTEICKKRVGNVVSRAAERIRLHGCSKLHVVVLGDLLHGAIHVGARVASEELVCDQLMQVSEILYQAINYLSSSTCVEETTIYMTYGNHARTIQDKHDSIHRDNIERIIPWWLKCRFENNPKVEVSEESENEFIFLSVCGHDICASHGDLDTVKSAPRLITTLFHKRYGKDIEYVLLGDKHHIESFNELGVTSMICGSLCGTDEYANTKRLYSDPSQILLIVNPEFGVDAEYRLKCD